MKNTRMPIRFNKLSGFGKPAIMIVLLAGLISGMFDLEVCKALPPEKPNFVFIFIDDLGYHDVGYMGAKFYKTPNIDKLASEGMIFTQAYANAANCAPTRASLLTGQYSPRHGVFTVGKSDRGKSKDRRLIPVKNSKTVPLENLTIGEILKSAGYKTAAIGKWNIGNSPEEQGFDLSVSSLSLDFKRGHFNERGDYLTDRLTDEAVKFIHDNSKNPFFLYLAHYAVHTPIEAKKEIIEKYQNAEKDGCHNNPVYAAMIESVDESVGRVRQTLDDLKIAENTVVIFFSDNGGYGPVTCMDPLRGAKGMFYEGGIREPMIVRWPEKVKPGSVCETPVIGIDFYPTFLDIAGITIPEDKVLDGLSILPLLKGKNSLDRDALFWHFPAYLQKYNGGMEDARDPLMRTRPVSVIREGNWKLMLFYEEWMLDGQWSKINTNNAVELYNLENDAGEATNLANSETKKRDELLKALFSWLAEIEAPLPQKANPEYVPIEDP
jgi:arylsulfatase A-like enzyme